MVCGKIVVSSLTSTCLGIALTLFWMVHVYFISVNMTTVEYCEKRRDGDYINHYDVGILQNFKQVFGTLREIPYWILPLQSPSVLRRGPSEFPVNTLQYSLETKLKSS